MIDNMDFLIMPNQKQSRGYSVFFKQPADLNMVRRPTYVSEQESEFGHETEFDVPTIIESPEMPANQGGLNPFQEKVYDWGDLLSE